MKKTKNHIREQASPIGIRIHKCNIGIDLYSSSFIRNITCDYSIEFSPTFNYRNFYAVESKDNRLRDLLSFENYNFLEYDFDRVLSSIMHNLVFSNKTFLEIAFSKNTKEDITGIKLIPFDAVKIASTKKHSWFLSLKTDKKPCMFKIEKNKYIEFNISELGLKKNCLKRIVKRLKRKSRDSSTDFVLDEKMKNKFSYNDYRKKQDYFILKYPKKIGWVCAGKESLITKCYMLFRIIRLKEFQTKCLTLFIEKINSGLNNISEITNASGTIKANVSFPDYQSEWQKYMNGEISSKMLEDIIFPKFVKRSTK